MAFIIFKAGTGRKPMTMSKDRALRLKRVIDGLDEATEQQKAFSQDVKAIYFSKTSLQLHEPVQQHWSDLIGDTDV